MTQLVADRRDIDFVLFEQLKAQDLLEYERYQELNKKTFEMVITEARKFGLKELLPTYSQGDREGVSFQDGKVYTPECYKRPFQLFIENEWTSLTEDPDLGGGGLPNVVAHAANEFLIGINFSLASYTSLGHGTGKLIELYGSSKMKELFLEKLYTGEWTGTMVMTEPEAGSDVGNLSTVAVRNQDGTYNISGEKIFITGGEHDLADNIVHAVLARVEGAPSGSKGLSLFIVPKIWVNEDGSLGETNDVVCTGVEEKMGIHGSATCSMHFGGNGKCRGFLLGEENMGLKIMFRMMNEARLGVGLQAFCHSSAAYLYALDYAQTRKQGRDLSRIKEKDAPQVPIISHPDVRRMLLWMKSHVEGMRSFVYYIAWLCDKIECAQTEEEKEKYQGLLDLLTPVLKAYNADRGFQVCVQAIQVYGGYGYIKDYVVEQLARDCKIASIYEGTDSIQAMDLLARKLGMKQGTIFMGLLEEIDKTIQQAQQSEGLKDLADSLKVCKEEVQEAAMNVGQRALSSWYKTAFSQSVPFLDALGDLVLAWMLLWRACLANEKLSENLKSKEKNFYQGQLLSSRFFIQTVLPETRGRLQVVNSSESAAVDMNTEWF